METTKKVIAINGSCRLTGTTTQLTEAALEGAASVGMDTEMILLRDKDIRYCTNCLMCYKDLDSEIAPCSINDDIGEILRKTVDSDGIILSSAVHNGFITGLMTVFFERMTWRLCRPTGRLLTFRGCPSASFQEVSSIRHHRECGIDANKVREKVLQRWNAIHEAKRLPHSQR